MNNEIFKKAFENVKPPEELVNRVLDVRNVPAETKRTRRRFSGKRVFGTAAAVCAVLICGITAAAVTGLIDFNAVFGEYIIVEDVELANSLIGTVSNFKYKVSDSDYKISIKGAMGTDGEIAAIAEISRKDGTPVVEHFLNPAESDLEEQGLDSLWDSVEISYNCSGGYGSYVNSDGNIEVFTQFNGARDNKDKKVTVKGENFYPREDYWDFCQQQGVYYMKYGNDFRGYVRNDSTYENIIPAEVDDSGVILLDLEWEFSFVFKASDKSKEIKSLNNPTDSFLYRQIVREMNEDSEGFASDEEIIYERTATASYIEIGSTGGKIDFEYETTEYDDYNKYFSSHLDGNELYIVLSGGEQMKAKFGSGTFDTNRDIAQCSCEIRYLDENGEKTYVDVDSIEALSINGTVYNLK